MSLQTNCALFVCYQRYLRVVSLKTENSYSFAYHLVYLISWVVAPIDHKTMSLLVDYGTNLLCGAFVSWPHFWAR
jgi:hypothetical protein